MIPTPTTAKNATPARLALARVVRIALAALLVAACSRKEEPAPSVAPSSSVAPAPSPSVSVVPVPVVASVPDAAIVPARVEPNEAARVHARRLAEVPLTGAAMATMKKQYTVMPAGVDVQQAPLTARGRIASLVSLTGKPTSDALPIVIVHDERGDVLWSKDGPVAGIMPPVGPLAIAAAPKGRVAFAACDPPTTTVALRLWDDDGSPFADFQAMAMESCDALALLYWPKQGWLIVAARPGATRARLVKDTGTPAWSDAIDVGARSPADAIAIPSVAADTDESFVLVQVAQPTATPGSPFHALAWRYDKEGSPIWKQALDLGEAPKGARAVLTAREAGVSVKLPGRPDIEVKPSGAFR
ncbi:MAG: hypothetical protein KIT84_20490 [Labilithrix sp.]|nr:hypothetical protein [Labilithrix sp.]MCW5813419.1 hypothetical protein [Labilithrix sp.]